MSGKVFGNQVGDLAAEVARAAAPVFAEQEWTWGRDDVKYVPDAPRIAATLAHLIEDCPSGGEARTGRFTVARWTDAPADVEQVFVSLEVGRAEGKP